jgi:hypothetical protein
VVFWAVVPRTAEAQAPARVVTAHVVQVVDDQGQVRAVLGPATDASVGSVGLFLVDPSGVTRMSATVGGKDGAVRIIFSDTSHHEHMILTVEADGSPSLAMYGPSGGFPSMLLTDGTGDRSGLGFYDHGNPTWSAP